MPPVADFQLIFERLKQFYQALPGAVVTVDTPEGYSLNTRYSEKWKKELFLGAVKIQKNYVSFHLMLVYMYPDLLEGISAELKKHMQGKSCFNFKKVDETLFAELGALVTRSIQRVHSERLL